MSFEDLRNAVNKLQTQPQDPVQATPIETLAKEGRDFDAIVSHREIEDSYDDTFQDDFLVGGVIADPSDVPLPQPIGDIVEPLEPVSDPSDLDIGTPVPEDTTLRDFHRTMFALDYTNRLIRSAMAVTGISATTERFNDKRKTTSFWLAWMDVMRLSTSLQTGDVSALQKEVKEISEIASEQVKKVPAVLTDPTTPAEVIPGPGRIPTALGAPEKMEWVFDLIGEIAIEGKATSAVKRGVKTGVAKLTKKTVEAGVDAGSKGGIKRILAQLTDEDLRAIAEARKTQRVGTLGTRPPQKQIDISVGKTFDYIEQTGEARLTKKAAIKAQRRKAAAKAYDVQGEGYGRGYFQRLRKAASSEKSESVFKPFLDAAPEAVDDYATLQKTIDNFDFGESKIYTTINAQEAIAKLYEFGELLTPGDVEHLRNVFGNEFANSLNKFTKKPVGVLGKTMDVAVRSIKTMNSTARTLMTTGELSFLLRQGNYRAWSRPQDAIRSFMVASRALASPKYAQYWDEAMRASAKGKRAVKSGLFLGRVTDGTLAAREEFFMSEWLHQVPGIGKVVKRFESGYVAGLNQLRVDWFDEGMEIIENAGRAGDDGLVAKWSDYVNNMTGRADLDAMIKAGNAGQADKTMEKMVDVAKEVMFAPRFTVSKWNRHKVAAELVFGLQAPAGIRKMLVTDTVTKWRRYQRLAHFSNQSGYEIETNPRSSDFLKIRRGNTRFDVLGGDAQLTVLIGRLATGETKDNATGEIKQAIAEKTVQDYLAGKLNPAMSLLYDKFVAQETFSGGDIDDPKVLTKAIAERFIPLYIQDVKDKIFNGYEQEGLTMAESIEDSFSVVTMGFLGAGVQTFPPSARKKIEMLYNQKAQDLFAKDFADLTPFKKQDAVFEVELDNPDLIDQLKSESGMNVMSPGAAAQIQEKRNKSFRNIRNKLGRDYKLFEESNVNTGAFGIDIGDIRLNTEQHNKIQTFYVNSIKQQLKEYPDLFNLDPKDASRRQWLQDIIDVAREDAEEELFFKGIK